MKDDLQAVLVEALGALGYSLWAYEWGNQAGRAVLRIDIEGVLETGQARGVTLDECVEASRHLSVVLGTHFGPEKAYVLELSTPGIERVLVSSEHYEKSIGKRLKLTLKEADAENRRRYEGQIQAVNDETVTLLVDEATMTLPISDIAKAKLKIEL